jgi:hypothetical protein
MHPSLKTGTKVGPLYQAPFGLSIPFFEKSGAVEERPAYSALPARKLMWKLSMHNGAEAIHSGGTLRVARNNKGGPEAALLNP